MIKLTVYSDGDTSVHLYTEEKTIIIGDPAIKGVDIPLNVGGGGTPHLVINCHEGEYDVQNFANDPFTTLNGEPFGRRRLQTGDRLEVGTAALVCEIESASPSLRKEEPSQIAISDSPLAAILSQAMAMKTGNAPFTMPGMGADESDEEFDNDLQELEMFAGEPWASTEEISEDAEIDALMREMEALQWDDEPTATPTPAPVKEEISAIAFAGEASPKGMREKEISETETPKAISAEDLPPFQELAPPPSLERHSPLPIVEPISPLMNQEAKMEEEASSWWKRFPISWYWGVGALLIILTIALLLASAFFFRLREQRHSEEIKAAQGVADIAMALTYAHFNQSRPQKQNWADPAFLRKNLGAVLAPLYPIVAHFDGQGQFTNTPYLLRVYTNNDLSQFLVIAQPAPNLMQWLAPKAAIVVDSRAMELRKLSDLRAINRLLVHAKTFDETQAEEISQLVAGGSLISLTAVAPDNDKQGFAPPRALSIMHPEAAQRIYNAPRYFLFGERILDKVLTAQATPVASDMAVLQQELQALEKLPHLVLYSTNGIKRALEAQKALASLAPQNSFWVGYLKLGDVGQVVSGQLLLHSDENFTTSSRSNDELATADILIHSSLEDEQHPFARELLRLKKQREKALAPLVEQSKALLQAELLNHQPDFFNQWHILGEQLQIVEIHQRKLLKGEIERLLVKYSSEPMRKLLQTIERARLDYIALDPLQIDLLQQSSHLHHEGLHKPLNAIIKATLRRLQ